MPTTIGHEPTKLDKALFYMAIGALIFLGVALAQPLYRGKEMAEEFKSDCQKRGGVLLEHSNFMGTNYKCASRLD